MTCGVESLVEFDGRYRDTVRDFWRGAEGALPDFATRLSGSGDLFGHGGRRPTASVNIVTVHDVADETIELVEGEYIMLSASALPFTLVDERDVHTCRNSSTSTHRLQLALLDANDDAYNTVCAELGDCPRCWRDVALTAVHQLANERALHAGSRAKAADFTAKNIQRGLT